MMFLDWKEAKSISLEVWDFFRKNPECNRKSDLPLAFHKKIFSMKGQYPLCEYLNRECHRCPLDLCNDVYSDYQQWYNSIDLKYRGKCANTIYKKIKKWNPQKRTCFAIIKEWIW